MSRPLRPAPNDGTAVVSHVINHLRESREWLRAIGCPQAAKAVARALKSVEGARRHMERRATPQPKPPRYTDLRTGPPLTAAALVDRSRDDEQAREPNSVNAESCANSRYCDDCEEPIGKPHGDGCFFHPDNQPKAPEPCCTPKEVIFDPLPFNRRLGMKSHIGWQHAFGCKAGKGGKVFYKTKGRQR